MAALKSILVFLLVGYGVLVALAYFAQRALMYFPDRTRTPPAQAGLPEAEEVTIETADGEKLVAWYVPAAEGKPVILYFHGNGGALINRVRRSKIISLEFVADADTLTLEPDWLTPHRHIDAREQLRRVQAGIERLPPRCRAVILLRKVEGLSTRGVADRLGIGIERIKPGHPQQNGRHERMHLTLKKEATKPACRNFLQQQARFDKFLEVFNNERPHEALDMKCPAEVYQLSPRVYQGLPDIDYPLHDKVIVVTRCGRICLGRKKINFSTVFAGQAVGIKEVHDDIWLVSFMDYDLGYFDLETRVLEPLENPFGPKVLPM